MNSKNLETAPDRVLRLENLHKVYKANKTGGTLHCYYGRETGAPKLGEIHGENRTDCEHKLYDAPDDILIAYMDAKKPMPSVGNLSGLVLAYRADPEFRKLAPNTQATWNIYIDNDIIPSLGAISRREIEKPTSTAFFRTWRNKYEATPAKANTMLTILKQVIKFAMVNGWISRNPVELLKPLAENDRSDIIWHDWELIALLKACSKHIAWAIQFTALTGLRRADALKVTWQDIKDGQIRYKTSKKGAPAIIPITPTLQALLDEIGKPTNEIFSTIIKNSRGQSYMPNSITQGLIKARNKIRKLNPDFAYVKDKNTNKHLHDLRGTRATKQFAKILANSDIAEQMGWFGTKSTGKYIDPIIALDMARTNKKRDL